MDIKDKKFYRYVFSPHTRGFDDNWSLQLIILEVIKETPSGYWISEKGCSWFDKHWVKKGDAKKKYARETKKKALDCYIYRTKKRINYLEHYLKQSKFGLEQALKIK